MQKIFQVGAVLGLLALLLTGSPLSAPAGGAADTGDLLTVIARGDAGDEIIKVEANGQILRTITLTTTLTNYTIPTNFTITDVTVYFTNNRLTPVNRNAIIDAININGTRYETEAPTTFSKGSFTSDNGCKPGYKQSEKLHCNGYAKYDLDNPSPAPALELVTRASANLPIAMAWRSGDDNAYVAELLGTLRPLSPAGVLGTGWDFSDRVDNEQPGGFLGLAFSPDGNWLYLSYTDLGRNSVLTVVPFDASGPDFTSEKTLISVPQPNWDHLAGDLHFGPDGYLYWSLGDGGPQEDPEGNAQNPDNLKGSVLRIDPLPASGTYNVPANNPFAAGGGAPEIWVMGLRNPWRFSLDTDTANLWIGDVGYRAAEEIDLITPTQGGANLGWTSCEGNQPFNGGTCDGFHDPIYTYGRTVGKSVTGGYVYRGDAIPELSGLYIFSDFITAAIWSLDPATAERVDLGIRSSAIAGLAQDPSGEVWVLSLSGSIDQIVAAAP